MPATQTSGRARSALSGKRATNLSLSTDVLEAARNLLQGAVKELTLDRTLFKKIQTTPKRVEVALKGEYYLSSGIENPELILRRQLDRRIDQYLGGWGQFG